jgi:hypothetical protein
VTIVSVHVHVDPLLVIARGRFSMARKNDIPDGQNTVVHDVVERRAFLDREVAEVDYAQQPIR